MFSFLKKEKFSANDIDNIINEIELIDVREQSEYVKASIKGSKNIPMNELLSKHNEYLDKTKRYHIICQAGKRGAIVTGKLKQLGYDAVNVGGGMNAYSGKYSV